MSISSPQLDPKTQCKTTQNPTTVFNGNQKADSKTNIKKHCHDSFRRKRLILKATVIRIHNQVDYYDQYRYQNVEPRN